MCECTCLCVCEGGRGKGDQINMCMHAYQHTCSVLLSSMLCVSMNANADNSGKIAGAVIGVLLVLAIIVGVAVAVGYLLWRSKSAKYIARRYAHTYVHAT